MAECLDEHQDSVDSIQHLISNQGYAGVFLAMLIENFLQFIPSEAIMPFAGFLVAEGKLDFVPTFMAGTVGTICGTLPWYVIGRTVNQRKLEDYADRHGTWFGLSSKKLKKSRQWFARHGNAIVFWGRLIPILRTVISIPAGIELMPVRAFLIWTALGSLIWNLCLTYAGFALRKEWTTVHEHLRPLTIGIACALVAVVAWYAIRSRVARPAMHDGAPNSSQR